MAKTQTVQKKDTDTQKNKGISVEGDNNSYDKMFNLIIERLDAIDNEIKTIKELVIEENEITVNLDEDNFTNMIFEYLNNNDKFRENIIGLYNDVESNYMKMGFNKKTNESNLYIDPKLFMGEMKKYFPFLNSVSKI